MKKVENGWCRGSEIIYLKHLVLCLARIKSTQKVSCFSILALVLNSKHERQHTAELFLHPSLISQVSRACLFLYCFCCLQSSGTPAGLALFPHFYYIILGGFLQWFYKRSLLISLPQTMLLTVNRFTILKHSFVDVTHPGRNLLLHIFHHQNIQTPTLVWSLDIQPYFLLLFIIIYLLKASLPFFILYLPAFVFAHVCFSAVFSPPLHI